MTDNQPTPLEIAAAGQPDESGEIRGAWLDAYLDLRGSGLNFRKAAYAAWLCAPKATRQPGNLKELAALLNLKSDQIFYKWNSQSWLKDIGVDRLRQAVFMRHIGDIDRRTIHAAMIEDGSPGVAARRLFYEQAKLATPVEVDLPVDSNFERALLAAYGGTAPPPTEIKEDDSDQNDAQI
jgi:hypothetical protein